MPVGTLSSTGQSPVYVSKRKAFKAGISGTFSATVSLEMRDSSGTWRTLAIDNVGTQSTWTVPTGIFFVDENENDREYRWNCTSYGSGTINWLLA